MAENTNLLNPASNNFFSDNNFLYKAIFVSILVLVIPLFIPASTQEAAPDFVNKTTSWEVVQLVLVGIAVSYGLFSSKRNDQPKTQDKEDEHDQLSYVSRLLQVPSSVFDDDDDEKQMVENNSKVVERTWNSQYYGGEPPIVVVAKESSSVDDANTTIEKVCLSPSVGRGRSLKPSPNNNKNTKEGDNYYYYRKSLSSISGSSSSFSTGTGKRRFSRNLSCPEEESKEEDNIVLRSPVPWRSRSGRMQLREEEEEEIQSKSLHEDVRKKMYPQSSTIPTPPPPPPLPPPPQRLVLLNNNKSRINTSTRYAPHNQDFQNRARQGGRLVEAITPTHKYHHSLSHDKEIESFIQTRGGSQKKNNIDDGAAAADDDDDDDDTKTQSFMEHPKKQQRQASASTRIKDSDQSSSSSSEDSEDEEDNDDELQERASTKNNNVINEEMMSGSDHNVDKKADEFIAKFREQIRLQRIASIRTTATQAKTKIGPSTR